MATKHKKRPIVGLYWRKLVFFAFVFSFISIGLSGIKTYKADINKYIPPTDLTDLIINLNILADGSVTVDGKKIKDRINTSGSRDELILPILDNVASSYNSVHVLLTLPQNAVSDSTYDIKGIHGIETTNVAVINDNTLDYYASGIGSGSTLSVIIDMPKGIVNPPLIARVYAEIAGIKLNLWLIIALGLPVMTLIFMVLFILYQTRRQKIDWPNEETDSPPMALPPAIAGVLYHQTVGPRELAATLIDLAERGDIFIIDRERDFAFLKNKFDRRLLSYEKILLSKIFRNSVVSNRAEVEQRINNHLYSQKISQITTGVYVLATRLGYFKANPQKFHLKYQIIGMGAFFAGMVGFLLSLLIFTNPPYILFFWAGMMVSGIIITLTAKNIPNRTVIGQETLSNWLAFRQYLSNPTKIAFDYDSQERFQKYLPYAIVLDCEVAWAKRFSEQNFILPAWYVCDQNGIGLQDFCLSLFPLVSYVARSLSSLREPGFE
ncbi:MAG TPA: DUF2207 domain-containing protein [Patescibacteria group bacterium]|nr:DUF2207 domain-containing protein [Patescibacteria group bacterium]